MTDELPTNVPARWVGARPWLPWPLAAWRWWTEPVGAERLAALRIGLALFLLIDVVRTYWPNLELFFWEGGPCGARVFGWNTAPPHWRWSVLRGLGDPVLLSLVLGGWCVATFGVFFGWLTRPRGLAAETAVTTNHFPYGRMWIVLGLALVGGSWSRAWLTDPPTGWFWWTPAALAALCVAALWTEIGLWLLGGASTRASLVGPSLGVIGFGLLTGLGAAIDADVVDSRGLAYLLGPWQNDLVLLRVAAGLWTLAIIMLLLGWQTRAAAVATWILNSSFSNLNPYIDNAGDVIRAIILFYLMLCPCGAVWSLDRWRERRRREASGAGRAERLVVAPWPLRLLFVQLVFIYFMNGVYKLGGGHWHRGESLHHVLCDLTLTRFSYAQFPAPFWLTQLLTWTVLVWETGYPLWVALPWTRKAALWFGVLFHLGIYATMELGNFVPYALMLYVPLLRWEKLVRRRS